MLMLKGFARHWPRFHPSHAHMVLTRKAMKTEVEIAGVSATQNTTGRSIASENPNKRRKIIKSQSPTGQSLVVKIDDVVASADPTGGESKPLKAVKRKAKAKMLHTLHTEATLPAIQEKAAQVNIAFPTPVQLNEDGLSMTGQWTFKSMRRLFTLLRHAQIFAQLMELYQDPPCPLDHQNNFQLLTSVILSAQVCPGAFTHALPYASHTSHCCHRISPTAVTPSLC
jgi:hypothetical protein